MQLLPAETKRPLRYGQGGTGTWKLMPLVFLNWCFGKSLHFLHIPKEKKKKEKNPTLAFKQHSFLNSRGSEAEGQEHPADVWPIPFPNVSHYIPQPVSKPRVILLRANSTSPQPCLVKPLLHTIQNTYH